jgi:alkyldihydroxyacetonephosphate synthase
MAHFSHAYTTGCSIYFTFSANMADPYELEKRYDTIWRTAMDTVAKHNGILSHHHGIGLSKRDRMSDETGAGVEVIRALKTVLDPQGILNPGKLIP